MKILHLKSSIVKSSFYFQKNMFLKIKGGLLHFDMRSPLKYKQTKILFSLSLYLVFDTLKRAMDKNQLDFLIS